jgi:response regulator RpfG family c-di-GMP phosphodiesterase
MPAPRTPSADEGRRIIICDYNALLLSVTGLLRMSGYRVFQAYDADAVEELCFQLPDIDLLILNTFGAAGVDLPELIRHVRESKPGLPVLHIGVDTPADLPADVPTISESFTSEDLLMTVAALLPVQLTP